MDKKWKVRFRRANGRGWVTVGFGLDQEQAIEDARAHLVAHRLRTNVDVDEEFVEVTAEPIQGYQEGR